MAVGAGTMAGRQPRTKINGVAAARAIAKTKGEEEEMTMVESGSDEVLIWDRAEREGKGGGE
jgi:hypothetical protein